MRLSYTQEQIEALKAIPAEKRRTKALQTTFGVLVFVGAFFLPKYLGFSWQVAIGIAALGGYFVSQDLVGGFLKIVPAAIRDVVLAFRGGGSGAGPEN